jgi:hypothetical protein
MQGESNDTDNPQSPTQPLSPLAQANKVLAFGTESVGMLYGSFFGFNVYFLIRRLGVPRLCLGERLHRGKRRERMM